MDKKFHPEMRIHVENDGTPSGWIGEEGITLREHYAGLAMAASIQGAATAIAAGGIPVSDKPCDVARAATEYADALIAALQTEGESDG